VGAGWIGRRRPEHARLVVDLTHADAAFVWACAAIVGFAAIVFGGVADGAAPCASSADLGPGASGHVTRTAPSAPTIPSLAVGTSGI
jgi:hypothetical protein